MKPIKYIKEYYDYCEFCDFVEESFPDIKDIDDQLDLYFNAGQIKSGQICYLDFVKFARNDLDLLSFLKREFGENGINILVEW